MTLCVRLLLAGICMADVFGLPRLPRQVDIQSEMTDLSDESTDIVFLPAVPSDPVEKPLSFSDFEENIDKFAVNTDMQTSAPVERPTLPVFEDPKVFGMNIGLHFLLESINRKMLTEDRVHLESMIKVLVMVHKIEKVGGTLNDNNKMALKSVAKLYPAALREAMAAAT